MSKIYTPTNGVSDWQSLLADPIKHWKTGYSARGGHEVRFTFLLFFLICSDLWLANPAFTIPAPSTTSFSVAMPVIRSSSTTKSGFLAL